MSTYPFCTASVKANTHSLLACWSTLFVVTRPFEDAGPASLVKKWKLQILLVTMQPALPFVRSKSGRLEHCGIVGLMTIRTKKYEREEMSEKLSFRLWTNAAFRGHQVVNTVRSILNNDHWMMEVMQTICSCFKHVWQQIACHYVEWYCPVEKVNYSFSTQNYPFWNYFLQKPRPAARRRLVDSGGGSYGEHPRRIPRCGQRRWQCP